MADTKATIRKIRAALALADRAGTEAEAATALATAHRLMAEHNLTIEDIRGEDKWVLSAVVEEPARSVEFQFLASILRRFFLVEVLENENNGVYRLLLFGSRSNVEIGTYTLEFLRRTYLHLWAEHKVFGQTAEGRRYDTSDQVSYFIGLTEGLLQRLARERQSLGIGVGQALVRLEDEAQREAQNRFQPKERSMEEEADLIRSSLSLEAGFLDSERVQIHKPLGDGNGRTQPPSRWLERSAPSARAKRGESVATLLSELEDPQEGRWRIVRDDDGVRALYWTGDHGWQAPAIPEEEYPTNISTALDKARGSSLPPESNEPGELPGMWEEADMAGGATDAIDEERQTRGVL